MENFLHSLLNENVTWGQILFVVIVWSVLKLLVRKAAG